MYKVIYDYIGENDSCKGIEEECATFLAAKQLKNDLKENPDYCNIDIIDYDCQ